VSSDGSCVNESPIVHGESVPPGFCFIA